MSDDPSTESPSGRPGWLTNRAIGGIVVAALLLLFIAVNQDATEISFIFFSANADLWVALALAGGAGFIAGFLISRKRYKP